MKIIDGKKISQEVIAELKNGKRPEKFFAAIVFGDDPESFGFLERKKKVAIELGVDFRLYNLPANLNNNEARKEVLKISNHKTCGGVLVQLPLPAHLNVYYVINVIPREKDVEVLGERALGAFCASRNPVLPPAVSVVRNILRHCNFQPDKVAVIGVGLLVGKPVTTWFMSTPKGEFESLYGMRVSELRVLRSGSDLKALRNVDLIVSGVGKPGIIKLKMLKRGAGVIDFGYSKPLRSHSPRLHSGQAGQARNNAEKLVGDLDVSSEKVIGKLAFYTPTPGGTGPILVAELFRNFYTLNNNRL